ncbi:conjugal transfer protein TraN [Candidatus Odyssella thessalonicensis]|uniref:conjugal transfer protein TraN n=1 Tax=Candidatus Odyssella thessalonicensis TaxID=84647 RepID=UPI000225A9D6|nr:conjugal transfer protein TraN [Candidatus Odyssella thessalonicensis]
MRKLINYLALVIALGASDLSWATLNPAQSEREAEAAIQESHTDLQKNPPKDPEGSVGYAGTNIPETDYNEGAIEEKKFKAAANNEAYKLVKDSIEQRPPYEMDVINDPIFKEANQILSKAEEGEVAESQDEPVKPSIYKCIRGRSLYEAKCKRLRVPQKVGTRQEEKTTTINLSGLAAYKSGHLGLLTNSRSLAQFFSNTRPATSQGKIIAAFKVVFNGVEAATGQKIDLNLDAITSVTFKQFHGGEIQYHYESSRRSSSEIRGARYLQFQVTTKVDVPVFELIWQEDCKTLESLIDQGECELVTTRCLSGPETRVIEGVPVSADCWEEELLYRCHSKEQNTCQPLLEKGCIQVASHCKTEYQGECLEWEQTFECYDKPQRLAQTRLKGDTLFCLDGNCVNQTWDPNPDMADSLSKLAIFKEMQKDMDPNTQTVFRGEDLRCSRIPASFKNCCSQKGWGMKVGMAGCSENEKKLAQQRKLNKCVVVGTYCAEKKLGVCVKKKTTFCCYQTKLARILNEQGRGQLGLHYGDPENPQCQGLTLTQFSKLDFSKLNLTELFQDLFSKIQMPDTQKITQGIQQSIRDQSRLITDKDKRMTQGRPNGEF